MAFITVSAFSTMLEELFGPPEACGVVKYENFFKQMNKFLNRNENKADFLQKESTIFIQREIESTIRDSTLEEEQKKQYKSIFERDFEHIKRYQELFSEIASSETEEEFRDAVGKFIGYFKEAGDFLPLVRSEGDEKNYDALWTNNGADSPHDDPVISENLLNEDKSFEIHVDYQRSPLLSRLWALVREPNPVGGSFIEQLQQGAETQRDFPSELTYYYDKILDPIFAEKIAESHSTNEVYRISFDNELKKLFNREESDGPRRYGAFINFLKANRAVLENKLEIGLPKDLCDGPAAELRVCTGFDGIMECLIDKSTLSAEIKEEYKKLSKEDNQHIKMHKELLEKIENSRDEKEFRDSVGEFIDHFKNSYFLPMDNINDNREKYALWTNGGIEGGLLDDKSRGYREYQDDSKSCLMRHIWNIVKDRCASDSKTPVKNGGFIEHLRKKSQSEETHINYDKILSEIYVEKMGPEKLTSLRIEYRQNIINPKYAKMHSGRVFYANELPVLLETTAKHNIELDKEYRKKIEELERKYKLLGQLRIKWRKGDLSFKEAFKRENIQKLEEESKQLEQAEKELQSERFSFVKALNKGETGNGKNAEVPVVPGYGNNRAFIESSSVFPLAIDFQKMLENTETLISHTRVLDELEEKARDSKLNALEKKVGGNKSFLSTGNLSRAKKEKEIEKKFLSIADLDEVSGNSRSVKNYDFYDGESIFKKEGEDRRSKLIGNNNDEEKSVEKSREELRVMAQVIREGKKSEEYKTIPGLDKKMIGSVVSAFAVGKALRDKDPNWRQNKGILDLDKVPKKYSLSEINEKDRELEGKKQKKKNGGEETISTFIDAPSRVPMVASPDDRTIGKNTGASIQGQKSLGEGGEATKDAITLTTLVGITNELEKNINVGNAENSVNNEK